MSLRNANVVLSFKFLLNMIKMPVKVPSREQKCFLCSNYLILVINVMIRIRLLLFHSCSTKNINTISTIAVDSASIMYVLHSASHAYKTTI